MHLAQIDEGTQKCRLRCPRGAAVIKVHDLAEPTVFSFLASRRSVKANLLCEPGPSDAELREILTVGARVPDHKKLEPWRFIVFAGAAREQMGEVFAKACLAEQDAEASPVRLETERQRFLRAPVVVAVVSSIKDNPAVPEWEQTLSAGAVGFSTCLAANAKGYGTQWLTEWICYSEGVRGALGLTGGERIAAFIYIGTPRERLDDRDRPDLNRIVEHWSGPS